MSRQILTTNREGWGRIFGAVRAVENGGRGVTPPPPQYRTGDDPPIVLGKIGAGGWAKGTSLYVAVYAGPAGSETGTGIQVYAHNKFATIAAHKWVMLAGPNQSGVWYLIAAECA